MNYASVILVAIFAFSVVYWYVSGKRHYIGPRVQVKLIDDSSPRDTADGRSGDVQPMQEKYA